MQNFLFYDPAAGEGEFYRSDGLGGISLLKRYSGWRSNWTHIIPGMFGGNPPPALRPSFLFYDGAGTGEFYTVDATGGIDLIRTYTGWQSAGKPWTHIIPGAFSAHYHGYDDLLFYDSAGTGAFYTVGGQAEITPLKTHTGWELAGRPWTHIIPGWFTRTNRTDLLFYDGAGTGAFYKVDGQGEIDLLRTYTGWQSAGRPWTHIIPLGFVEGVFVYLFYDSAGTGSFYTVDEQAGMNLLKTHTGWQSAGRPWTHIIPFIGHRGTGAVTVLLFYDSAGTGKFYTVDGRGELALTNIHTDWRSSWTQIVPERR